jgi:hypothetical protein
MRHGETVPVSAPGRLPAGGLEIDERCGEVARSWRIEGVERQIVWSAIKHDALYALREGFSNRFVQQLQYPYCLLLPLTSALTRCLVIGVASQRCAENGSDICMSGQRSWAVGSLSTARHHLACHE